jgi:two-component sensor histidine kinase
MIATVYLAGHEAGRLVQYVVDDLAGHFPEYRVDYCVIDPGDTLLVASSTSAGTEAAGELHLARVPILMETIVSSGRLAISDVANDPAATPLREELRADGTAAVLLVLVPTDDRQPHFLRFRASAPHPWSNHEILSLEEHANLLALILANERSQRMIQEANASLALSLEEKNTLLKEVHHRVKNNLNVIVSLLRLQEDQIDSVDSAREAFEQSRNRIFSMALVHESLYQSESLSEIEMDVYIRDLLDQLIDVSLGGQEISYVLDLEPIRVDITRAIPCGIILNELLTNIRKHAFTREISEPSITVAFRRAGKLHLELSVADNGLGLPADFSIAESTSLGLHLIHLLTEQMNGTVEMISDNGTRVTVRIPDNVAPSGHSDGDSAPSAGA